MFGVRANATGRSITLGAAECVLAAEGGCRRDTMVQFLLRLGVVPEALVGPTGYFDDVAMAAYILHARVDSRQKDLTLDPWAGDKDLLSAIRGVLEVADSAIGFGLWRRLKGIRAPFRRI